MLSKNWKDNFITDVSKKAHLDKVTFKHKIKVNISDDILNKIKYLCNKIDEVEWSGILLYSIEGTIRDSKKMCINIMDIIPMHKGSFSYTEYNFNDSSGDAHMDYCEHTQEAINWNIGHIHSHNNMGVFFSATDMEELEENSFSHNFYLSIIVNNKTDIVGKIGIKASIDLIANKEQIYTALDENGEEYSIIHDNLNSNDRLYIYDCDIKTSINNEVDDKRFIENVNKIIKASIPKYIQPANHNLYQRFDNELYYPSSQPLNRIGKFNSEDIEIFIIQLLGLESSDNDSLIDLFDHINAFQDSIDFNKFNQSILDTYLRNYRSFFGELEHNEFENILKEVIEAFKSHQSYYPFIEGIVKTLTNFLNKYNGTISCK